MAILSMSQSRAGDILTVVAVSDLVSPTFHWYLDGSYVGSSVSGSKAFQIAPGEQARIDVVDSIDAVFDPIADGPILYPSRLTLEWVRSMDDDTAWYEIAQTVNFGASTVIGRVRHDGRWSYRFTTARLIDLAVYQFSVTPIDRIGNVGPPLFNVSRTVVRHPDAPIYTAAYNAGNVIVEAA